MFVVSAVGLAGLVVGYFIGAGFMLNSLEQNGYYFKRAGEKWVMWYRHPKTSELVRNEGYSDGSRSISD